MATLSTDWFRFDGWGALLLLATLMTLCVTATALAIGAVLGAIVAAAKLSGNVVLVTLGNIYTTVFRGVPELLIIYLIYFGGSSAITSIGKAMGYEGFLGLPSFLAGALAVGIISGAYQAEVFRGAFQAISKGELEAASAIGMHARLAFAPDHHPAGLSLRHPGYRQCLAAEPQGFGVDLGHRPCRVDAHQPGGCRFDAAVFPVLHRRRHSLSDPDQPFRPRLQRRGTTRQPQHADRGHGQGIGEAHGFRLSFPDHDDLLKAVPMTLALFSVSIFFGGILALGIVWMRVGGNPVLRRSPRVTSSSSVVRRC
jgi:His/Glu/Gln/Arg/opine family amino acid ABC transporter permease subunit